jgi:hypothetical protein
VARTLLELMLVEAAAMRYHDSEEEPMTHAYQLRTEGRQEGRQESRLRDKREVLVRQLQPFVRTFIAFPQGREGAIL